MNLSKPQSMNNYVLVHQSCYNLIYTRSFTPFIVSFLSTDLLSIHLQFCQLMSTQHLSKMNQRVQAALNQQAVADEKRRNEKEERRKSLIKRKNPFPFDKQSAMRNRDGNPYWVGVLWLDSIHTVSTRSYGCNKKLFRALVEDFLQGLMR